MVYSDINLAYVFGPVFRPHIPCMLCFPDDFNVCFVLFCFEFVFHWTPVECVIWTPQFICHMGCDGDLSPLEVTDLLGQLSHLGVLYGTLDCAE